MLVTDILTAGTAPLPAQGPLPLPFAFTGTFATSGIKVIGTSTTFTKDLVQGDYLYDTTQNEIRRVASVFDDTTAFLESAFTLDSSAQAVKVSRAKYTSLIIQPTGVSTIDGVSLTSTSPIISLNDGGAIKPLIYTGAIKFTASYQR